MSKDSAAKDVDMTKPKSSFRPDLSQSTSIGEDSERILSSIKTSDSAFVGSSRRSSKLPSGVAILMLATAAAAGAGYWYFATQTQPSGVPKFSETAKPGADVVTTKVDATGSDNIAGAAPAASSVPKVIPEPAAVQAAQIVNEPKASNPALGDSNPAATNAQAKLTDALEKDIKPPGAAIQKALEGKAKPAVSKTAANTDPATSKKVVAKASPKADSKSAKTSVAKVTPSGAAGAAKPGSVPVSKAAAATSTKTAPPAADQDANLIAALLTHNAAAKGTSANTQPPAVKVAAGDTATVQSKTSGGTSSPPAPSANKPVAVARSDTSESALKKCESLDFLKREVCRFRACDKLWEVDASCKATLTSTR